MSITFWQLLAALALLSGEGGATEAPADSHDWYKVAGDDEKIVYVDFYSITVRSVTARRYWEKTTYKVPKDGIVETMALVEANCTEGKNRLLQMTTYDGAGRSDTGPGTGVWHYIVPETFGERAFAYACQFMPVE